MSEEPNQIWLERIAELERQLAEARMAVALAYQKAADLAETDRLSLLHRASIAMDVGFDTPANFDRERADTARQIARAAPTPTETTP